MMLFEAVCLDSEADLLGRRLLAAGHEVVGRSEVGVLFVPFELVDPVGVQLAGLSAHFGCVVRVVDGG